MAVVSVGRRIVEIAPQTVGVLIFRQLVNGIRQINRGAAELIYIIKGSKPPTRFIGFKLIRKCSRAIPPNIHRRTVKCPGPLWSDRYKGIG